MDKPEKVSTYHISLLGGLEIRSLAKPLINSPTRKAEALLAVLARHPGRRHAREALAALLWPESSQAHARTSLRQSLKHLRQSLPAPGSKAISAESDALALQPAFVEIDVAQFEQAHEAGTRGALAEAARLYRGDFLEGFAPISEPFDEWLMFERLQLRARAMDALSKLLPDAPAQCPPGQAIQTAVRLLSLDPLQEPVHRLLMRLYLAQGRRGAALAQYRSCRTVLKQELGVAPDRVTETLHRELREVDCKPIVTARSGLDLASRQAIEAVVARPAVAVLPLTDLGDEPGKTYFADGLSEDVITALAGWRRFPLIASSSTLTYRNDTTDVRQIADDLGAQYVVTGSIRHAGERARISVRLIESDSGRILWTERYDVELGDILDAQEECARQIATAVEPQLERAEARRIVVKRTDRLSAWDRFLQGISCLNRFTAEDNALARMHFQQAIEVDPGYSDAYTGLAESYLYDTLLRERTAAVTDGSDHVEPLTRGFEAAREAVALDPDSSSAHHALGHAYVWAHEFDAAIAETERAIELNPSNANARRALGNRLDLIGRTAGGITQMEWALHLNPRDPRRWVQIGFLVRAHLDACHYEEALVWARRAVRLRPDQPDPHFRLAACLAHLGRRAEARAASAGCERLQAGFMAEKAAWRPYADSSRTAHFFAGLRQMRLIE